MCEVLVITNRKPAFFQKFSRKIFGDVEANYDTKYIDREDNIVFDTVRFLAALIQGRPDVVWVAGSGFATFWICLFGKLMPNTTVVFYHNDFTYQHMRDFKQVPWWRLQVERLQEGGPLLLCDVVGTMTDYHERYLRNIGYRQPFFRVPHGVDTEVFRPGGEQKRAELGIGDRLAVGVMGTFNRSDIHDIMYGWTVVEALAHLRGEPIVGVFIGGGKDLDHLRNRAETLDVEDSVIITGRVPHEELPEYLAALDVTVLVKPDHPADKMTTTMKLPEYLAVGSYILADDHAYAASILNSEFASLLPYEGVKDESFPIRLAEELQRIAADHNRLEAGKDYSRRIAKEEFEYERIKQKVLDQIQDLL